MVTTFALEPFIVENYPQDPEPFPYLKHTDNYNFDINLQVDITRKFFFKKVYTRSFVCIKNIIIKIKMYFSL